MTQSLLIVVDDEREMGEYVSDIAESVGFETSIARSVTEFRKIADSHEPEVVVLGLVMPDIDGIELIRELHEKNSEASIILISGFDSAYIKLAAKIARARGLRLIGHLGKPFRSEEMKSLLGWATCFGEFTVVNAP